MRAEIKTLVWLQWRLFVAMFRTRRLHIWARLGRILLMLLMLFTTIPAFLVLASLLAFGMTRLSPAGAYELAMLVNCGLFFLWLMLPGTYSSDFIERFEMTRLFVHPIRFRSLVAGSTIISMVNLIGFWSALILAGELVGLAWHDPRAIPVILIGAIPLFAILALAGRLMDDVFDLIASDRRLKGLMVFLLSLPFMLLIGLNYVVQIAASGQEELPAFLAPLVQRIPPLDEMGVAEGIDAILTSLSLSRYLVWLPPGWSTAGMALPATNRWLQGLLMLVFSLVTAGALLWAHSAITRRLMAGAAIHIGAERVRLRQFRVRLPGPPALWVLFHKDWLYLTRSPITKRILFATPFAILATGVGVWQASNYIESSNPLQHIIPLLGAGFLLIIVNLATATYTSNYFGSVDREGFSSLMVSSVDRRFIWLSANLTTLLLALVQSLALLILVAAVGRSWPVLPWGLFFAVCLHIATAPAYNVTSVLAPYRARMDFSNQGGNIWIMFAWIIGSLPVGALCVIPLFFWPPGLAITLPLAGLYSVGLYLLTLKPLADLLDRRVHQIQEAITENE
jgi:hypothetical protein